jgi:diacylglycerol O-acyltransferase
VEQLHGIDAGFLYMETPTLHMHTLKVAIIDPAGTPGGYSFERFQEVLAEHLHQLPPFRRRLVEVPFGLGHPFWIDDPNFQLGQHVSKRQMEQPGDSVKLCRIISEVAGQPLDRSKPLWEMVVVEGLAGGRLGIITKIHHSVADGLASLELLMNVMDDEPGLVASEQPATTVPAEAIPSSRILIWNSFTCFIE